MLSIEDVKAIAEEGFIYGPMVMNYRVNYEFWLDKISGPRSYANFQILKLSVRFSRLH